MDFAAWGPTIVTVAGWIFFGGVMWSKIQNQEKRQDAHEKLIEENGRTVTQVSIDIAKLNSWKEGYAIARSLYDRQHPMTAGD